ncbi:hypothetical protein [Pseudomonas sp. RT6P73]
MIQQEIIDQVPPEANEKTIMEGFKKHPKGKGCEVLSVDIDRSSNTAVVKYKGGTTAAPKKMSSSMSTRGVLGNPNRELAIQLSYRELHSLSDIYN